MKWFVLRERKYINVVHLALQNEPLRFAPYMEVLFYNSPNCFFNTPSFSVTLTHYIHFQ
jgi:hypothetical protein